jgi:membrane associated rhomboid family serine protease
MGGGLVPKTAGRVTIVLIGINVLVWLGALVTGGGGSATELPSRFLLDGAMLADSRCYSDVGCLTGVDDGGWWRLLTSTFLHLEWWHLLANMYALWVFGPTLERLLGYGRFLALYLTCGLAGSVAVLWFSSEQFTLGASGAIFGLFGAAILILLARGMDITALLVLLGINLFITFTVPSISWQGHVGGLAAGLLLGLVFAYAPRAHRDLFQALAFGGMWVAMVALVAAHAGV